MGLHRVEDRPTPKAVYNWRVWTLAGIASFASCMIGYDSAFIGGTLALPSFLADFGGKLSSSTQGNLVSTYQAGAFFGAFAGLPLGHYLGRKWGLFITSIIFNIGSIIMTIASPSTGLTPIYVGRAIAGLAIGAASNLTPIYIAEIAPVPMRGQAVGVYEIGWQIGGIVGFFINYSVLETLPASTKQWRIPFAVQLIPGGLFAIGALFLIESPRWLLQKGRTEEARKNLKTIRNLDADHPYLVEEFDTMRYTIEQHRKAVGGDSILAPFRKAFGSRAIVGRLLLGCALFAWQNATAINVINYYSPTVFKSLGITGTSTGLLSTGIFGIIKTTFSIIYVLFLVETVGRRNLLLIGSIGCSLCLFYISAYIFIAEPGKTTNGSLTPGGVSALVAIYVWTAFYGPTWNPTPWVINSEMFPHEVRSVSQACGSSSNWLWNFIISKTTPYMFDKMTAGGVYIFFASLLVFAVPFVFFLVPETKAIPVEAMDRLFQTRPRWRAHKILLAELRAESAERQAAKVGYLPSDYQGNGGGSLSDVDEKDKDDKTRIAVEA